MEVMLVPAVSVCWLVCKKDYTKTTDRISMKLSCKMDLGPEYTPLTFGMDQITFSHFL